MIGNTLLEMLMESFTIYALKPAILMRDELNIKIYRVYRGKRKWQ